MSVIRNNSLFPLFELHCSLPSSIFSTFRFSEIWIHSRFCHDCVTIMIEMMSHYPKTKENTVRIELMISNLESLAPSIPMSFWLAATYVIQGEWDLVALARHRWATRSRNPNGSATSTLWLSSRSCLPLGKSRKPRSSRDHERGKLARCR